MMKKKFDKEIKELHEIFLKHPIIKRDNRKVETGDIFWALKGKNNDGNKFASDAIIKGAHIAVVDNKKLPLVKEKRFFFVKNTLKALQDLGSLHRDYVGMPVIGITGSNGKTTTKELINSVLSQKYNTSATHGNYNNHIGVPLTLLNISEDVDIAIVEMGTNHFGEIEQLCKIADPDFGIITSIGKAHLKEFKNIEGVLQEKTALFRYLKNKNGIIFVNADDKLIAESSKGINSYKFSFNKNPKADLQLKDISKNTLLKIKLNNTEIQTKLVGKYNLSNIGYAIAVGKFFNLSDEEIKHGLENYVPQNMRSQIIKKNNNLIILDTYNANPTSMRVALENLLQMNFSRKVAILGDMFELGEKTIEEHQVVADFAKNNKIETYLIGKQFSKIKTNFPIFENVKEFKKSNTLDKINNANILIKASRSMELEKIIE